MAETFRPPKAVHSEFDLPASLTAVQVAELRNRGGATGAWARRVVAGLESRASFSEEKSMDVRDDMAAVSDDVDCVPELIACVYAALAELIEAVTPSEVEDPLEDVTEPLEPISVDAVAEVRRSAIATAEKRNITAELRTEIRADGSVAIRGYAAVFNREADGLPFREMIKPGAFARSLDNGDECYLLVNHNTDELPLARRNSGTLTLSEDETGLLMEAVLDPTNPRAAEVISVLTRGDASEMSFAFTVAPEGQTRTKDGLRELRELNLFEVSICTWGAYSDTSVGLRSADIVDDLESRWLAKKWQVKRDGLLK